MITNITFPKGLYTFSLKEIHLSIYKTDFKERHKVLLIKFGIKTLAKLMQRNY